MAKVLKETKNIVYAKLVAFRRVSVRGCASNQGFRKKKIVRKAHNKKSLKVIQV